jgi:hypothetical protein
MSDNRESKLQDILEEWSEQNEGASLEHLRYQTEISIQQDGEARS